LRQKILALFLFVWVLPAFAEVYIRGNFAYHTGRSPELILFSQQQLRDQPWTLSVSGTSGFLKNGLLESPVAEQWIQTPMPFNYKVNLGVLTDTGTYVFHLGTNDSLVFEVRDNPYPQFFKTLLYPIQSARSGSDQALHHPVSHLGDSACILYRPLGQIEEGKWEPHPKQKKVDVSGGFYDAGDYIKFTLTNALATWLLLRAWEVNPEAFKAGSTKQLPALLIEARHGLQYLMKLMPTADEFIIQVSTGADHKEGFRLPQDDKRNGHREALSAISPAHMGYTAAALAAGARVFALVGFKEEARGYRMMAERVYARATAPDALPLAAYEKDATNDFYRDPNQNDNMALAAYELYQTTLKQYFLSDAKQYAKAAGLRYWVSWGDLSFVVNSRLAGFDLDARERLKIETQAFLNHSIGLNNVWGIPMQQYWAPLPDYLVLGGTLLLNQNKHPNKDEIKMALDILDYILGRNNWGVSFIGEAARPSAVQNFYSQIYQLQGIPAEGMLSEGPGARDIHEQLKQYFDISPQHPSEKFNTDRVVFFDHEKNFQTMEGTLVGQAAALYFFAVLQKMQKVFISSDSNETTELLKGSTPVVVTPLIQKPLVAPTSVEGAIWKKESPGSILKNDSTWTKQNSRDTWQ
jgi:hypothetical protein